MCFCGSAQIDCVEFLNFWEDGSCIFRIDVVINFEMYSVFMSYGPGIKIIYPKNAMKYMRDKLKEALDLYDTTE